MQFSFFSKNLYLRGMKMKIDWKKFILFAIIAFCLALVTDSLLMSAGIFLLLLVVDYFIAEWEKRHKQNNLNKK